MEIGKSLKNNYYEIFSQKSIPIENYTIKGDQKQEHEIQKRYIQKILVKWNPGKKINNSLNPSLSNTTISKNEKITNFTILKKQKSLIKINEEQNQVGSSDSDNNDEDIIYNKNNNNSSEFLLTLFNQGICPYEENRNKWMIVSNCFNCMESLLMKSFHYW